MYNDKDVSKKYKEKIEQSDKFYGKIKSGSTGTENYYVHKLGRYKFLYTDGVKEVVEKYRCYWFLDIILSHMPQLLGNDFVVCRVIKENPGSKYDAIFYADDGDFNIVVEQKIDYTDLKQNLHTYFQFDGEKYVLMMPEEY